MADAPPLSSPVSWQTIFWTLVPLALNNMSQPGGRVSGLPSRYRTYLRCSPMLCTADLLSIFTHILVCTIYVRLPAREALGTLFHERFNDPDLKNPSGDDLASPAANNYVDDDMPEGLQSVERMSWLRWLFFVLGTLPPAIKLLSMRGVPWTQAWGALLLVSWTINESLVIIATLNQSFFTISPDGKISWPGYEQTVDLPRYLKARRLLNRLNQVFATVALMIHVAIMNGVFRVLWRKAQLQYVARTPVPEYHLISPSGNTVVASFIALIAVMLMTNSGLRTLFFKNATWKTWLACAVWLYLAAITIDLALYGLLWEPNIVWIFESAPSVYLFSATLIVGLTPVLYFGSLRFIYLGRNLLILCGSEANGDIRFDYGACLALAFFNFTVLTSGLWYCYIYDPTNTLAPLWTGIFG